MRVVAGARTSQPGRPMPPPLPSSGMEAGAAAAAGFPQTPLSYTLAGLQYPAADSGPLVHVPQGVGVEAPPPYGDRSNVALRYVMTSAGRTR